MGISDAVLKLHGKGFNLIPLQENSKQPVKGLSWKRFQYVKQTLTDLKYLFTNHEGNIGVICGEVSGNLVVLDADSDVVFTHLWQALEKYGVKVVRSPRGGHIYFKSQVPVKSKNISTPHGKVELRSTGLYVVAENSMHPSGIPYLAINNPPELPVFNLGKIPDVNYITLDLDMSETDVESILKESGLISKIKSYEYESRSQADMALITFLVRKGYDKEAISHFLIRSNHDSKYLELVDKNASRASAWLDISIKNASELSHTEEFLTIKKEMADIKEQLVRTPINGRSGATLYKVLLAHLSTCESSGKLEYHLSVREASEKTGVSHVTFIKQNKWLIECEIIEVVRQSLGIEGNIYKINLDVLKDFLDTLDTHNFTTHILPTVTNCASYGYVGMFERGSYGHSANQIYNTVKSHHGLSVPQIVASTGRSMNTVRRILKKLCDVKLLIREGNTYSASEKDIKEFAFEHDYVSKSCKRRYNHIRERINYRENMSKRT
jgi:hypothetical protein